ncbi:hypothetical protein BJ165DRAFT_857636 [Panaeolus papilionaceus]|nr:hypothetical protein BJ165DRAFT_857636 [Panaeolus papilionaceus]
MHQGMTLIPTLNLVSPDDHAPTITSPPTFPVELYLEIISQISHIPVSCYTAQDMNPRHPGLYRHFTLSALSQTCRTLRRMVLPYLWETIEVLDGMELGNGRRLPTTKERQAEMIRDKKNDAFAKELLRQLNIVTIQSPSLAQHVLNMNIRLVHHPTSDIYDDIYSCMKLLPNLTTVRLLTDNPLPQSDTGRRLDALPQFPQIQSVYLSDTAWRFFPQMCPNLIHVASSSESNVFDASWNMALGLCFTSRGAKTIKVIGRNPFRLDLYKELQAFANLRDLTLEADVLGDLIVVFSLIQH